MTNGGQGSKIMRIIAMPIRLLAKARDFYVNSMNNYADGGCYGGAALGPMTGDPLPRSFSVSSTRSDGSDDLSDLVRAASTKVLLERIDLSCLEQREKQGQLKGAAATAAVGLKRVPRSASVGMAMIDEEKASDFEENDGDRNVNLKKEKKKKHGLFGRSRSYAVSTTKRSTGL
ncbi:hypothetical protein Ancab_028811 [Ancistrocladus abbreviatus]